ncbi:invasin domain 3-containing protein [Marinagarivorans algicola]|uniref:invasin domain 3-containing protein n=1 Tax=Marinagarivorans algicola TaxID=1513270 RepID=UPI001C100722|nr:invasin domain 3-containing protein [Marinagarivorans algicola]
MISGTLDGNALADDASVSFTPDAADTTQTTVTASATSITADGVTTSTITVQAQDANGNNLVASGGVIALSTTAGTLSAVTDNGDGTYTATLTSSTTAENAVISGTLDGNALNDTEVVTFNAGVGSALTSTLTSSSSYIAADGVSTTQVTLQALDAQGNALMASAGVVTFSTSNGTLSAVIDNGDGTYSATLTSSTLASPATVTATLEGQDLTNNVVVNFTPGAIDLSVSTITASEVSITADGTTTSLITVQAMDSYGNAINASAGSVELATTAGMLSDVIDNGDGSYSAVLTSSTLAQVATVTGSVNGDRLTMSADIAFTAGMLSASQSTLTPSSTHISADGTSTSVVTLQAKDSQGNSLTVSAGPVILNTSAGTLSDVTDNGDGTYSAILTSSTTAGSATLSATLSGEAVPSATVNFVTGAASAAQTTIALSQSSIIADGISTSVVTLQAKDLNGNLLNSSGGTVVLNTSAGTLSDVVDNNDGTYNAILTSSTVAEEAVITGTIAGNALVDEQSVSFVVGVASAANTIITTQHASLTADGVSSSHVTIQLADINGNLLTSSGGVVALSITSGTLSDVIDNGDGTYSAVLTAPTVTGEAVVTGTLDNAPITDDAAVMFTPGAVSEEQTTITAVNPNIVADNTSGTVLIIQARDQFGNDLATSAGAVTLSTTAGTLSDVIDNGDGTYSAILTSSVVAGEVVVTATISGTVIGNPLVDTEVVKFVPGDASGLTSTISAASAVVVADGVSTTQLTVQAKDSNGNNLTRSGGALTLASNLGSIGAITDNNDGTYTAILTSSTLAGVATITGTVAEHNISQTTDVEFVAGNSVAATTTIVATNTVITADGMSTTTLTVQAKDANGNPLMASGGEVTLSTTAGMLSGVIDNGDGTYTATLTSSTTTQSAIISGALDESPLLDTETVAFTAGAADTTQTTIIASAQNIMADGITTSTLTVQVKDANGNPLLASAGAVVLNTTAGTLGAVTDNDDGTYTAILTSSTMAESALITGTIEGDLIEDTADIEFTLTLASATLTTLEVSPDTLIADGTATSTITIQLYDDDGNPLMRGADTVVLSTSVGTLTDVVDNGDGTYTAIYSAPSELGALTGEALIEVAINGEAGPGATLALTLDPAGDEDGDGMPNNVENNTPLAATLDTDGDGIPNYLDSDDDNDGIPSIDETVVDTDGDGIINALDRDSDGDSIPDAIEGNQDSDNDLIADYLERDSDDDGLPDTLEAGASGIDTDGDGIDDAFDVDITQGLDVNNDGVDDAVIVRDSDNDGLPDYLDKDSDNDALPDTIEAQIVRADTDADGIDDAFDVDVTGGEDANLDGIDDAWSAPDTDGDKLPDYRDPDSDNDTIPDAMEGGATGQDDDKDGIDNAFDVDETGGVDANSDGIDDDVALRDSDGDGTPDYQDVDSDNDTILDSAEAGSQGLDTDQDGIDDAFDVDQTGGVDANNDGIDDSAALRDSDGDGTPDYIDPDSDNDGIDDKTEGTSDTDGDGLIDAIDPDSDGDGMSDADESTLDSDGDGIADYRDNSADEDGDGIPDIIEGAIDSDNDGIIDAQDLDSDNDGIPDIIESGASGLDSDNDGIDDAFDVDQTGGVDANNDGIDDAPPLDSDGDGTPNSLDADSDNDGIPDAIESNLTGLDDDGDGIDNRFDVDQTGGVDANGDGIDDAATLPDTDGDGLADGLDQDSDNDGISDTGETQLTNMDDDGDGIDNTFDVDSTGGNDLNNDGIDDDVYPADTDGDGIIDSLDLDSDNDGIIDFIEAGIIDVDGNGIADDGLFIDIPPDTDNDGTPDHKDLDSDGDGFFDITDTDASLLDTDGDGQIDPEYSTDTDGDGIVDLVDDAPDTVGTINDPDGDGIASHLDLDDDNDGIPDTAEGNGTVDSDGDGIPDSRDLDSDNDGIADVLEANINVQDLDGNGLVDDFVDDNNDGLADFINTAFTPIDSDNDMQPDFRDLDSDNDGLFDLIEAMTNRSSENLDKDGDGRIDRILRSGVAANLMTPIDTDKDATPDYRDVDSDGDGFSDTLEGNDYYRDLDDGELTTAVKGSGGSINGIMLIGLFLLTLLRLYISLLGLKAGRLLACVSIKKIGIYGGVIVLSGMLLGQVSNAQESHPASNRYCGTYLNEYTDKPQGFLSCWYGGLGLGLARIHPEGRANGWATGDNTDTGWHLVVGRHFTPRIFAELKYADLGEAGVDNENPRINAVFPEAAITYKVPSLMAGLYAFKPRQRGVNVFAKAGVSAISNKAKKGGDSVPFSEVESVQLSIGLGVQYDFKQSPWLVKLEIDSYDRDARYGNISIVRYFGRKSKSTKNKGAPIVVPVAAPVIATKPTPPIIETCTPKKVASKSIFFGKNSAALTVESNKVLNELSQRLIKNPRWLVELESYTDSDGSQAYNLALSNRRAHSAADFFISRGISRKQLMIKTYGESLPIASNGNESGKSVNRRVVLNVNTQDECD